MFKSSLLLICLGLSLTHEIALAQECEVPFTVLYQTLNVKTDLEYVKKIHDLYSSTITEGEDIKDSQSAGISVFNYGSGDYDSNKSKVTSIYNKLVKEKDYALSKEEHSVIAHTYTREGELQIAVDGWLACIEIGSNRPRLVLEDISEDFIMLTLKIPPTEDHSAQDQIKITNVYFSPDLTIDTKRSTVGKESLVNYDNEVHYLAFKRTTGEKAKVSVSLSKGYVRVVEVPSAAKIPKFEQRTKVGQLNVKVYGNKNRVRGSLVSNVVTDQHYVINVDGAGRGKARFKIQTNLEHAVTNINGTEYRSVNGGPVTFNMVQLVKEDNGTFSLKSDLVISPQTNIYNGIIKINYTTSYMVCIQDCN